VSKNLEQNHVFELFERLTRDLIVHQPENPIEFLIKKLKNPPGWFSPVLLHLMVSEYNFNKLNVSNDAEIADS
jgi:hypothetical protein